MTQLALRFRSFGLTTAAAAVSREGRWLGRGRVLRLSVTVHVGLVGTVTIRTVWFQGRDSDRQFLPPGPSLGACLPILVQYAAFYPLPLREL